MSPGTLTPDRILWRHASSVGKPSCRAAVVAADSGPMYRAWVRRAVIAPEWVLGRGLVARDCRSASGRLTASAVRSAEEATIQLLIAHTVIGVPAFAPTRQWLGLLAVVAGNLLPLVGVAVWGWSLDSLLVVYWLEALTTTVVAAGKALFAKQGSPELPGTQPLADLRAKRGGLQPRAGWPPIYPRNIPFAVSILGTWAMTVLPVSLLAWLSLALAPTLSVGLLVGLAALIAAHLVEFRFDYIADQRYAEVSARELTRTPAQQVLLLICLLPFAAGEAASGPAVLGGIVLAKTAAESYRFSVDHMGQPLVAITDYLERSGVLETEKLQEPPPELAVPDDPIDGRVDTDTAAVMLGSVTSVALGLLSRGGLMLAAVFAIGITAGQPLVTALAATALLSVVAATLLSRYLRFGTVEYQRHGSRIVAYDRLLAEPQWIAPVYGGEITVDNAVPDRLLDTGTLTLSTAASDDRETVQLGPVADLDAAVDTLGLPISEPRRPDTDYAVVGAAGFLLVIFAVVPLGLVTVGDLSEGVAIVIGVVSAVFLLPLVGVLLWAMLSRV